MNNFYKVHSKLWINLDLVSHLGIRMIESKTLYYIHTTDLMIEIRQDEFDKLTTFLTEGEV